MLQPRRNSGVLLAAVLLVIVDCVTGVDYINTSPRRRRQDSDDVTTVLLVDSHGRSSFGRFLNVKPDLGLITSTARTFIQEGVTTEYATQVLGTTLDNGRLYAQLLTKSSRVLYDNDLATRQYGDVNHKKWKIDGEVKSKNFVKNTDFISPNQVEPYLVFPTSKPDQHEKVSTQDQILALSAQNIPETSEEELLKSSPSNNLRVPYIQEPLKQDKTYKNPQNNVKVFQITPQMRDITQENLIQHREDPVSTRKHFQKDPNGDISASKVRQLDNLPTFTVRNEFAPSGFSFLGDLPNFDPQTERTKPTTAAERKAKLLFRAGFAKPEPKDLKTVTYTGFADFTTTVGDTVIIFTPHTSKVSKQNPGQVTKISVEPTIRPKLPIIGTSVKTFLSRELGVETVSVEGHKLDMQTVLPTMVIDASDRHREPKSENTQQHEDMEAKSAVLAHEQQLIVNTPLTGTTLTPSAIEPSESQIPMLSTPSDEEISKIFASLQALNNNKATEPLQSASTIFFDDEPSSSQPVLGGATTIFFEDDLQSTATYETTTPKEVAEEKQPNQEVVPTVETTTKVETTTEGGGTTEKEVTTLKEVTTNEPPTTSEEAITVSTPKLVVPPKEKSKDDDNDDNSAICSEGNQIIPTTMYKTLTYLTTFFIPQDESTSTSIKSNKVVSTEIGFQTRPCVIDDVLATTEPTTQETTTEEPTTTTVVTTEQPTTTENDGTTQETTTEGSTETTTSEVTTERHHVTESDPESETTTDNGEEVELIFKTLYTTYTYLTTYFQDTTSSVASRIVVTTNVITSTLEPGSEATDPAVAGLFAREDSLVSGYKSHPITFEEFAQIAPSSIGIEPSDTYSINENENNIHEGTLEGTLSKPTPALNDAKILETPYGIKTYYTTYTYFTTIFVDGETEISSRTEVYTNYVTPTIQASGVLEDILPSVVPLESILANKNKDADDDDVSTTIKKRTMNLNVTPSKSYNSTIIRQKTANADSFSDKIDNNILTTSVAGSEQNYVTLHRSTTENSPQNDLLDLSDYETVSTMVTDVRSSTSEGDRRIIDSVGKRNVLLDDQIVSESNNESEIVPSPTLLLQTSYTTFTYFTTMYHGTTSSDIVSRLETITNVVTETLTPTHSLSVEDLNLPITYFTTFTYWTTLYKDGTTKVTSREETVSNVVTPSVVPTTKPATLSTISITPTQEVVPSTESPIGPSSVVENDITTFYTTYTYYTTSYVGDKTVINSRLETVTEIQNKSKDAKEVDSNHIGRALGSGDQNQIEDRANFKPTPKEDTSIKPTGLLSTIVSTVENSGTTTILSTDVYGTYIDGLYAKVLESTSSVVTPTKVSAVEQKLKPTGVVSINKGKIVDADGVSTLYYTTRAVGTYIDNLYAQVIESTSSLNINQERKSALPTDLPTSHRLGLVRLIEGSVVQNNTTTFYQSKVLGTSIDGRYAQVIESTSSFLVNKPSITPSSSVNEIVPSPTKAPHQQISATKTPISPSPVVIEGSLGDSTKLDEESTTEGTTDDDGDDEDRDNTRTKSRLTFQTRKRTFTPVIRPFASRPRPTFAPKRKGPGVTSATTITRSDFTPTVIAVPASKGRFGGGRKSSISTSPISPTASSSRRFSRPKSSTPGGGRRSSSRIQPSASSFGGSSRRGGGFRSSSPTPVRPSTGYGGNSRFRIRPTLASSLSRSPSSSTPQPNDEENDLTTSLTENPTVSTDEDSDTTLPLSTTTESSSRRSQNPLLRFRRPPLSRSSPPVSRSTTTPRSTSRNNRNGNRVTTTTTKPKSYSRTSPAIQNRARPPNALFPRRGLFTTTTTTPPPEENEEEPEELEEGDEDDTEYEGTNTETRTEKAPSTTTTPPRRGRAQNNPVQIKPFNFRKRTKRESTYSRFRRPGRTTTTTESTISDDYVEDPKPTKSTKSRFTPRGRAVKSTTTTTAVPPPKRISPSKASGQNRSQFTLREKDITSSRANFKRPTTSRQRTTTAPPRPKAPRLRNDHQNDRQSYRKTTPTTKSSRVSNSRRRQQTRRTSHSQEIIDDNFIQPRFDGTITVTHQIPTEVTIPVVNGKVTEYKNVVTAKYSTQVLGPRQYSTTINPLGKEVTVLLSEATNLGTNGATEITQFVLNETPTTSVIFTPTYIRGRKTSFSHVIPSTVYLVEPVVNTIQPALAAQAPLANILLSQLLLGGIQPQNPYLALQNGPPPTPTTEYKTRSTTYVTTITSETSTVLPLTFRGKEILTTIIDSSTTVVTATEFITDTIVVTPTVFPGGNNQLNSLLVPLLLQQQQQQQTVSPILSPQPAGVIGVPLEQKGYLTDPLLEDSLSSSEPEEEPNGNTSEEVTRPTRRKTSRKRPKKPTPTEPPKETSVITLYVSGKTPGEFTTVLSTINVGEDNRKRRHVSVEPSKSTPDLVTSTMDWLDTYVMPASIIDDTENPTETESLESIIGDVTKHLQTKQMKEPNSKKYNVGDLGEHAPLVPKVETSSLTWGELEPKNYVSNLIGIDDHHDSFGGFHDLGFHVENFEERHLRYKREVPPPPPPQKRRVVKKLIRVEPIYNTSLNLNRVSSKEINYYNPDDYLKLNLKLPGDDQSTPRPHKKRIIVKRKKKKKRKLINNVEPDKQGTKMRRKIVVTKKRLLPKNGQTEINPNRSSQRVEETIVQKNVDTYMVFTNEEVVEELPRSTEPPLSPVVDTNDDDEEESWKDSIEEEIYDKNFEDEWNSDDYDGELKNGFDDDKDEAETNFYDEEAESNEDNHGHLNGSKNESSTQHYSDDDNTTAETTTVSSKKNKTLSASEEDRISSTNSIDLNKTKHRQGKILGEPPKTTTTPQPLPDYEPFFPELSENLNEPVLLLKTTVLSSIDYITKTVLSSKLRTYTFIVTKLNGDEQTVSSTTEVKPHTKTVVVTEPITKLTTLTLLDLDATETLPFTPLTVIPSVDSSSQLNTDLEEHGRGYDEARHNLATRVMSNGVEVIVAGDKSTLPGEPDVLRILPSSLYKPVTLKPSTLSDHMMMMIPQDASDIENLSASLYPNQFVTKTCLTTFTYLTTFLENGTTSVSSHEQVVSNIATEERNTGKIVPTPSMGITLTQYPNLAVGIFLTTYTYLNTILDGEQPIVVTSKHTVTNTVTAPDDYLSLLLPSKMASAIKDTNTYYSTISLQKTIYEGDTSKVVSTNEIVTQVVITESVPPKATTSIMTSYIALDVDHPEPTKMSTTDVTKTYFVTYTYYNTLLENGSTVVKTNISTSSDVVTEKVFLQPKKTTNREVISTLPSLKNRIDTDADLDSVEIFATKTYLTTFTYFTTLLQEDKEKTSTVISSHSRIVENIVTETIHPSLFDKKYLGLFKDKVKGGFDTFTNIATFQDGQQIEITAINKDKINPTKVLPIDKTQMPSTSLGMETTPPTIESSNPSVITGSTIVFFDDDPFKDAASLQTPSLSSHPSKGNELGSLLSSEILTTPISSQIKPPTKVSKATKKPQMSVVNSSKPTTVTVSKIKDTEPTKKKPGGKIGKPTNQVSDLLGLGSININSLHALTPVLNAMAGLIKTNLKTTKKNETLGLTTARPKVTTDVESRNPTTVPTERSPIYIPVGGLADDIEVAESQNIANVNNPLNWDKTKPAKDKVVGSPLLSGGIPISPGDVITTNSDVIVGKPGRVGPRIPSIPLIHDDEIGGMKPPPVPNKVWPKRNVESPNKPIPLQKIVHAPNKDDYVGPPPKVPRQPSSIRDIDRKRNNIIPINTYFGFTPPVRQKDTQKNFDVVVKDTFPGYPQVRLPVEKPPPVGTYNNFGIQPSVVNEAPLVLPEVIERSTGQPLLVNIQPSQVAFVNIPHNRTTALIYGGSTEPHKNGQYFDDPSPYPEPEFSGDTFTSGVSQYPPVYGGASDQKQVGGVIKVGTHHINVKPEDQQTSQSELSIQPSKPLKTVLYENQDINIQVPPISFGMVHQGDDFNAHIINHGDIQFSPPPLSYNIINERPPQKPTNARPPKPNGGPTNNLNNTMVVPQNKHQHPFGGVVNAKPSTPIRYRLKPQKHGVVRPRPRPTVELVEYMTPPQPVKPHRQETPTTKPPQTQKTPLLIPLHQNHKHPLKGFHDSGDLVSEDGQLIQESNRRPLRPGEIPIEILRAQTTTARTTPKTKRPMVNVARPKPFGGAFHVRPENQQSNQINHYEHNVLVQSGNLNPMVGDSTQQVKVGSVEVVPIEMKRPHITSLPIDSQGSSSDKIESVGGTQTEEPFRRRNTTKVDKPKNTISIGFGGKIPEPPTTTLVVPPNDTSIELNMGEVPVMVTVTNKSAGDVSQMEILKPPPMVAPGTNMKPPKIEVNSPSGGIQRVPNIPDKTKGYDLDTQANTPKPYVPEPSEDMVPPPKTLQDEQVMGLSPPPPVTTHKPILAKKPDFAPMTTHKPVFSLEIDAPTSTEGVKRITRPRRPFTRRPPRPSVGPTKRPPKIVIVSEEPIQIKPSPTVKTKHQTTGEGVDNTTQIGGIGSKSTPLNLGTVSPVVLASGGVNSANASGGGDGTTIAPTRYITYTMTSTITVTETTVVKTPGGPPSTLTIVVTKTEKSTIVDTVTEIHTLLKPTSIVETFTTTINQGQGSLYPPDVGYGTGSVYSYPVEPTLVLTPEVIPTTLTGGGDSDGGDSDDHHDVIGDESTFIITETDPPPPPTNDQEQPPQEAAGDGDSFFVVMTDKNRGSVIQIPKLDKPDKSKDVEKYETQSRDEVVPSQDANNVLLGGILIASPPNLDAPVVVPVGGDKCNPECKPSRNELCQRVEMVMRCVCRPGFARMFPDRPCKPTYTYTIKVGLERNGKEQLHFDEVLRDRSSPKFIKLAAATHEGLDRMVMQSDLRDIYHGIRVKSYEPAPTGSGIINHFYLQLSDNADENRLQEVFRKYLRNNNYSLGGTEVYASKDLLDNLSASDFDECTSPQFHDCSEHAQCFNLRGTYTCSCKEGFADLSENVLYPGRICSAELVGCERCHYHGTCYSRGDDQVLCECFQWYAGENCHVNLKVLLIALVTLGAVLFTLLLVCIILTCARKKPSGGGAMANGMSFLPQRVAQIRRGGALDRRAMIPDTSSESSQSDTNTLPYVAKKQKKPKGALKKTKQPRDVESGGNTITFMDQKDRSLTVMIPRAKYHPAPPTSPLLNISNFDKRKTSGASSNETKLLSYLDAGPSPKKVNPNRKYSTNSDSYLSNKPGSRKTSGALISAGFEVSATVVNNTMGTLGTIATTCGTEADRSENATLIQKISADLLSTSGTRSQFNTLRGDDGDPMSNWLDITPRITLNCSTASEARSYDETTIPPPTKSFRNGYDSKQSSQHHNDEANTMAERDLGSTFLLPHTHLYKPDRGSDISGFESL